MSNMKLTRFELLHPALCFCASVVGIPAFFTIILIPDSADRVLAIEGAAIITGTGDPAIPDGVLLIEGPRIRALGQRGYVKIPDRAERIDASGKWLIPGLIDLHVHMDEVIEPAEFLLYGVTSVRDVGSRLVRIQRIRGRAGKGEQIPRIFWTGRNIDEGKPSWWGAVAAKDAESVPALIQDMARQGVDAVKLYTTAGPRLAKAVIREAHERGIPVTGHLEATPIASAARMGIDGLEHVSTLFNQLGLRNKKRKTKLGRAATADLDSAKAKGLIRLLASERIAVTPTLVSSEMPWRGKQYAEKVYRGGIPAAWSAYWASDYRNFIKAVGWTREDYAISEEGVKKLKEMVLRLHRAKVPIAAGTDTPAPWVLPGAGLLRELELYAECGLTSMDALRAATGRAAWALRKEAVMGTIRPGRYADFVLLDADPLEDIRNLRRIHAVYQGGRQIDRNRILTRIRAMKPPTH